MLFEFCDHPVDKVLPDEVDDHIAANVNHKQWMLFHESESDEESSINKNQPEQ